MRAFHTGEEKHQRLAKRCLQNMTVTVLKELLALLASLLKRFLLAFLMQVVLLKACLLQVFMNQKIVTFSTTSILTSGPTRKTRG